MSETVVSILVPVYNHAAFLPTTIESVLKQTYGGWELLIVDDCSTDDSGKVIEEYAAREGRIRAFRNTQNRGLVENWRFLIEKSRGEYLAFLEGDDAFTEENLSEKLLLFSQHPEVSLVYSNYQVIDACNQILIQDGHARWKTKVYQGSTIPSTCWMNTVGRSMPPLRSYSQSMVRGSLLAQVGYPRSFAPQDPVFIPSDWDFHFRLSTTHKVWGSEKKLLCYRMHEHNQSRNVLRESIHILLLLQAYIQEFTKEIEEDPAFTRALSSALQRTRLSQLSLFVWEKRLSKRYAVYRWLQEISKDPWFLGREPKRAFYALCKIFFSKQGWAQVKERIKGKES